MKTKLLPVLVLLCLFSCASTPTKRHLGEVIDDAVISNRLKFKYLKDDEVSGFDINIGTRKGIVTLRGSVEDQRQINRAIEIAERENGVREVKSYLYVDSSKKRLGIFAKKRHGGDAKERDKGGPAHKANPSSSKGGIKERSITE